MTNRIRFALLTALILLPTAVVSAQSKFDAMDPLSKMFLLPKEDIFKTPEQVGLVADEIEFANEQGHQLRGWYIKTENATQTVMVCQGNAYNSSVFLPYAKVFADGGFNVLLFDYQGYGRSDGIPSFASLMGDVQAAYDFLTGDMQVTPDKIGVFGVSLGSALSLYLCARNEVAGLAVEDAFVPGDMLQTYLDNQKPGQFMETLIKSTSATVLPRVDPIVNVKKIDCPIFLMHGQNDWLLPPKGSFRVFSEVETPARIWMMKGVGHAPESLEIHDREYAWQLQRFFREVFAKTDDLTSPNIVWSSTKLESAEDEESPATFQTELQIEVDGRAFLDVCLMDKDGKAKFWRPIVEGKQTIVQTTAFEPMYASATVCRFCLANDYDSPNTADQWRPDYSKMSQDRADFFSFAAKFQTEMSNLHRQLRLNNDQRTVAEANELRWETIDQLLPNPESIDPHIQPYYVQLPAFFTAQLPIDDNTIRIWERILEFVPENPKDHFRLGNASFDVGYRDLLLANILARMIPFELERGNVERARQLLQVYSDTTNFDFSAEQIAAVQTLDDYQSLMQSSGE